MQVDMFAVDPHNISPREIAIEVEKRGPLAGRLTSATARNVPDSA